MFQEKDRNSKYTPDGFLEIIIEQKLLKEGVIWPNYILSKKKSIIIVGSFIFVHGGVSQALANKYTIAEVNDVVTKWMCKNNTDAEEKIFDEIFRDDDDMSPFFGVEFMQDDGEGENTEQGFNRLLRIINQKNQLMTPVKGVIIAHTPQFMDYKYLNSAFNDRLWRIDVGIR